MMNFLNQLTSGVGNVLQGGLQIVTSPLALIGDICGGFGGGKTNNWWGSPQGSCCCGTGGYNSSGGYQHEMTQNARIASLERRQAYDDAMNSYRFARYL